MQHYHDTREGAKRGIVDGALGRPESVLVRIPPSRVKVKRILITEHKDGCGEINFAHHQHHQDQHTAPTQLVR